MNCTGKKMLNKEVKKNDVPIQIKTIWLWMNLLMDMLFLL